MRQPFPYKGSPKTLITQSWCDCQRRQSRSLDQLIVSSHCHGAEDNVPHDLAALLCDEPQEQVSLLPQSFNQSRSTIPAEGLGHQIADCGLVVSSFGADEGHDSAMSGASSAFMPITL